MRALRTFAVCTLLAVPSVALAQFAKPENAIKYRQAAMFIQGQHVGRIGGMVKGTRPFDQAEAARSAEIIEGMLKLPWEAFGSGTDKGAPTNALPAIWKEPDKFRSAQKRAQEEAAKLVTATKSGDQGAVKTAFGGLAKACDGCHDDFRKE
jgi:cytochrome c556